MGTRSTPAEREAWTAQMRETLPPGSTVYTVLRHVSASGMTRTIDAYALTCENGSIDKAWLSYRIAAILGWSYDDRREAVRVGGAGMDMGFHLVYTLSAYLYRDGFDCTGERCPSNEHTNGMPRPHEYAPSAPEPDDTGCAVYRCGRSRYQHPTLPMHHRSGGYALRQEWI